MSEIIQLEAHRRPRKGLGYEPPETDGNYLQNMAQGTRFLAKRKGDSGSLLSQFILCTDPLSMPVVCLGESQDGLSGSFTWRDPDLFCQDWKYYFTLEVTDVKNGNSNKIQPGAVESHGNDPGSN
jgi:hypothetical protein